MEHKDIVAVLATEQLRYSKKYKRRKEFKT